MVSMPNDTTRQQLGQPQLEPPPQPASSRPPPKPPMPPPSMPALSTPRCATSLGFDLPGGFGSNCTPFSPRDRFWPLDRNTERVSISGRAAISADERVAHIRPCAESRTDSFRPVWVIGSPGLDSSRRTGGSFLFPPHDFGHRYRALPISRWGKEREERRPGLVLTVGTHGRCDPSSTTPGELTEPPPRNRWRASAGPPGCWCSVGETMLSKEHPDPPSVRLPVVRGCCGETSTPE